MKKVLFGLMLLAGISAGSASAATYNLGTLATGDTVFGSYNVGAGLFSDKVNFSLASGANLEGSVGNLELTLGSKVIENISNLNVALYNSSGTQLGSGTDVTLSGLQPAGNYYAVISGTGTGTKGGIYAGAFSVSAVPEPSTWGMLLMGLGLVGFTMSRRKV